MRSPAYSQGEGIIQDMTMETTTVSVHKVLRDLPLSASLTLSSTTLPLSHYAPERLASLLLPKSECKLTFQSLHVHTFCWWKISF